MAKITVQNTDISVIQYKDEDYISLTDMARSQMQEHIIFRWLSLTLKAPLSIWVSTLILIVPNSVQLFCLFCETCIISYKI